MNIPQQISCKISKTTLFRFGTQDIYNVVTNRKNKLCFGHKMVDLDSEDMHVETIPGTELHKGKSILWHHPAQQFECHDLCSGTKTVLKHVTFPNKTFHTKLCCQGDYLLVNFGSDNSPRGLIFTCHKISEAAPVLHLELPFFPSAYVHK